MSKVFCFNESSLFDELENSELSDKEKAVITGFLFDSNSSLSFLVGSDEVEKNESE